MAKNKPILKSIIWTCIILLFPVSSGIITQILMMNNIQTMFIQGSSMLLSLTIPIAYVLKSKISFKEIGLRKIKKGINKTVLFYLPAVIAEIPLLLGGINLNSIKYVLTLLFFALAVGISEEIYFRGIILKLLKEKYSIKKSIIISATVFGIGHMASVLAGESVFIVLLQIVNAFVFGIIAAEIVTITKSLIPTIIWHFVFNFVNYITLVTGINEIIVTGIQEIIMIIFAFYLWKKILQIGSD